MINIVHVDIHCNDYSAITALEIKLKAMGTNPLPLVVASSKAFYETTLLADVGKSLATKLDEDRSNVVDVKVSFRKDNSLTFNDLANFLNAFQEALDKNSR